MDEINEDLHYLRFILLYSSRKISVTQLIEIISTIVMVAMIFSVDLQRKFLSFI